MNTENKEIIIIGDINCNYLNKNNNKDVKELFTLNGFIQLVNDPTRITDRTETLIDVILSTKPENCLLYTSPSPRDKRQSRMPSSA